MNRLHRFDFLGGIHRQFYVLIILTILMSHPGLANASPLKDIVVNITVTDCETGQPISGANVVITSAKGKPSGSTDANGFVSLSPVRPGDTSHTIVVSAPGYLDNNYAGVYMEVWSTKTYNLCLHSSTPQMAPADEPTPQLCDSIQPANDMIENAAPFDTETYRDVIFDLSAATLDERDPNVLVEAPDGQSIGGPKLIHTVWYKRSLQNVSHFTLTAHIELPDSSVQDAIICAFDGAMNILGKCRWGTLDMDVVPSPNYDDVVYIEVGTLEDISPCTRLLFEAQTTLCQDCNNTCRYSKTGNENDQRDVPGNIDTDFWSDQLTINDATISPDDPSIQVGNMNYFQGFYSVWYRFDPQRDIFYNYDQGDLTIRATAYDANENPLDVGVAICAYNNDQQRIGYCKIDELFIKGLAVDRTYLIEAATLRKDLPPCTSLKFELNYIRKNPDPPKTDIYQICEDCSILILKNIIKLSPLAIVNDIDNLIKQFDFDRLKEKIEACVDEKCRADVITQYETDYASILLSITMKLFPVTSGVSIAAKIVSTIYDLMNNADAIKACFLLKDFVWKIIKEANQQGYQVNAQAIHSPAWLFVTDAQGRRAGFLEDGSLVEEIPDSKAVIFGEDKYVFFPGDGAMSTHIQGNGEGVMDLEIIDNSSASVREIAFDSLYITSHGVADLDLDNDQPVLTIDSYGDGNVEQRVPNQLDEFQPNLTAQEGATNKEDLSASPPPGSGGSSGGLGMFMLMLMLLLTSGVVVYFIYMFAEKKKVPQLINISGVSSPGDTIPNRWVLIGGIVVLLLLLFGMILVSTALVMQGQKGGGPLSFLASPNPSSTMTSTDAPTPEPTATPKYNPIPEAIAIEVSQNNWVEVVYVTGGTFLMGSEMGEDDEKPLHKVELDDYLIDKTEVSNVQYTICVKSGACTPPYNHSSSKRTSYYEDPNYANFPVIHVDWAQANAYCAWAGGRLPTEAEWEKAAHGTNPRSYPWGDRIDCEMANYNDIDGGGECVGDTQAVGSYPSKVSFYGALDMAGNVWEWVSDWYGEAYYSKAPEHNPPGPDMGENRGVRGGSWRGDALNARTTDRNYFPQNNWADDVGFRCVYIP